MTCVKPVYGVLNSTYSPLRSKPAAPQKGGFRRPRTREEYQVDDAEDHRQYTSKYAEWHRHPKSGLGHQFPQDQP